MVVFNCVSMVGMMLVLFGRVVSVVFDVGVVMLFLLSFGLMFLFSVMKVVWFLSVGVDVVVFVVFSL